MTAAAAPGRGIDAPVRYTRTAVALHGVMALAIAANVALAWSVDDMPLSPARLKLLTAHKWIGIAVLGLAALRLAWRLAHRPPPLAAGTPPWQRGAAHAVHALLYALFFAVPASGWMYSSAAGFPVVWLGVWPLPDLVAPSRPLAATLKDVHGALAGALLVLVALHIAAALKHHFVDRDGLLRRMAWR